MSLSHFALPVLLSALWFIVFPDATSLSADQSACCDASLGSALLDLARDRDDDPRLLMRAMQCFECAHESALHAEATLLLDSARDSLRSVFPLVPWLLGRTYAADLFADVTDAVVERAVLRALRPLLAREPGVWLFVVTQSDLPLRLAVRAAIVSHDDLPVVLLSESQMRDRLSAPHVAALLNFTDVVAGGELAQHAAILLCNALHVESIVALTVTMAVSDDLVAVNASLFRTGHARFAQVSSGSASGENRAADAAAASWLVGAALLLAATLPPLLRRLEWLDSPTGDSDAYHMQYLAAPIGVLLAVMSPFVLDQLLAGFLPMLRPESPAQLAASGWWYPVMCALLLQIIPLLIVAVAAPRLPRLADALRERWLAPALGGGVGLGLSVWLIAGHLVLRSTVDGALATAPLLVVALFFCGRAAADALGGLAASHPHARLGVCVLASAVILLDGMLAGSTHASARFWCRCAAVFLGVLAPRFDGIAAALWATGKAKRDGANGAGGFAAAMAASRASGGDDDEARELLAKDFDALRQRVTAAHGLPLVGSAVTARRQVREALAASEPFRFVVLRGPRGHGKSRTIADAVADCGTAVQLFVGDATVDQSEAADARCPPYEPIRKAIGRIVGLNRFKSAKEQWAVLEGAADFAESLSGLGLVLGVESGDGGGGGGGDSGGAPIDTAVLADAVVRAVVREARQLQHSKQRMVLLFEDMENCDKESGQLLTAAVTELARRGGAAPLTMIVCERCDDETEPSGWLASCVAGARAAAAAGAGAAFEAAPATLLLSARPLTVSDVHELLERIGFQPAFAAQAAPSVHERAAGSPLWLSAMLRVLVSRRDQLESTVGGWRLPVGKQIDDVELPSEIKAALMCTLKQLSQEQLRILHFASHMGIEFEASVLASAMRVEPMALLWELVQIESTFGVVHDVIDVDDLFRFASGGFVSALRGYASELLGGTPSELLPTQLSRQCHLQIADALVRHDADVVNVMALQELAPNSPHSHLAVPERSAAAWFRLARHAVAAGAKRASLAFIACCAAARAARAASALDATVRYCNAALACESAALSTAAVTGDPALRDAVVSRADATRLLLADSLLFVTAKNSAQALRVLAGHSQPTAPAAQILRALAHAYAFNLAEASQIATELAERGGDVPPVTRSEALWVLCFAAMKGGTRESFELSEAHGKHALTLLRNDVDETAPPPVAPSEPAAAAAAALDQPGGDLLRLDASRAWLIDRRDAQLKRAAKCVAAKTLGVLGGLYIHCLKELPAAEIAVRHSLRLKRDVGDLVGQGIGSSQLALILMRRRTRRAASASSS
jgi:hypothetical protein